MTLGKRIAVGAALCALVVLFVHPGSRPLFTIFLNGYGYSGALNRSTLLSRNIGVLGIPTTEVEAGMWMQVGADKQLHGHSLKPAELASLCAVADHFAKKDPDNAFWLQMGAVFHGLLGEKDAADEHWRRASACARWDDYQTERLQQISETLQAESTARMAWQKAYAIRQRSHAQARVIEPYGRSLLEEADLDTPEGLDIRAVTLRNGVLLRDGAGSLESGKYGIRLVESSALPVTVLKQYSPRALQLARLQLANNLQKIGRGDEAAFARDAFKKNEAWIAITGLQDPEEVFYEQAIGSVAVAVLPGASLICAILGGLIASFGLLFRRKQRLHFILRAPYAQGIGIGLAVAAYVLTSMPLMAMTFALCFAFASYMPERSRSSPPEYLGPFFRFILIVLAVVFSTLVMVFVAGLSTPTVEVFSAIDIPPEYFGGQTLPLALAALVLALVLLVGPSWAMVLRIPTPEVLGRAIQELGLTVLYLGLVAAIGFAPISLALNARFDDTLGKLLVGEPAYYLRQ